MNRLFCALVLFYGVLEAKVGAPRFLPPATTPGGSADVLVTAFVPDAERNAVVLESPRIGLTLSLLDDGLGADAVAGDAVYSARITVPLRDLRAEDCLEFRVRAGLDSSRSSKFCATGIPVGPAPIEEGNIVGRFIGNELLVRYESSVSEREMLILAARSGARIVGSLPQLRLVQWRFAASAINEEEVERRAREVSRLSGVAVATPSARVQLTAIKPNDPGYFYQPNVRQIRTNETWVAERGGPLVAVVDTGIEYDHPELKNRIQSGGKDYASGKTQPRDDHGHGSHVAGIIAAQANNNTGIAGIAWISKILPQRVFKMVLKEKDPVGSTADTAAAIIDSVAQGARVINLSLGAYGKNAADIICPAVEQAVEDGAVVVAAAGNDTSSNPFYPAACPDVIAVASVNAANQRSDFTNHGPHVDLSAPGESIYSTLVIGTGNGLIDCPMCSPSGYGYFSGTSMAAPHVSGVAALLLARYPNWTPEQVEKRLKDTARSISSSFPIGAGVADAMGAVMDSSFEDPDLESWTRKGIVFSLASGPSSVPDGQRMAMLSTAGSAGGLSRISQKFTIQPGVGQTTFKLRFAILAGGKPVNSRNHRYEIRIRTSDSQEHVLASGRVTDLATTPFLNAFWSGWKTAEKTFDPPEGPAEIWIQITDTGDTAVDYILFADDLRFPSPLDIVNP